MEDSPFTINRILLQNKPIFWLEIKKSKVRYYVWRHQKTCSVCVKQALNTRPWLVNALVKWHVSYKVTTLTVLKALLCIYLIGKPANQICQLKNVIFWQSGQISFRNAKAVIGSFKKEGTRLFKWIDDCWLFVVCT